MQFMNAETICFQKTNAVKQSTVLLHNIDFPKASGLCIQKLHSKSIYLSMLLISLFFGSGQPARGCEVEVSKRSRPQSSTTSGTSSQPKWTKLVTLQYYFHFLCIGGLAAVIYTDTLQTVVMTIGAFILCIMSKP